MDRTLYLPVGFKFHDSTPTTQATIAADTEAAVFIPEIWANRALGRLREQTCMASLCIRDYEDQIATQGDTVNVTKRGTLHTHSKTPNTSVTLQNPSASKIPVVLDQHKEVSFLVEDVAEAQSNQSVLDGYIEDAAIALGEDIDLALLGIYGNPRFDPANVVDPSGNSDGSTVDEDDFLAARTTLVVAGKAGTRPRYLVIQDLAELITVDKFVSRDYVAEGSLEEASIGRICGFQVFENTQAIVTPSPKSTHRLAFVRGAITLVTRRLPNPPVETGVKSATIVEDGIGLRVLYGYNMDYLGMQVTLDILYGSEILRPEWLCEIAEPSV